MIAYDVVKRFSEIKKAANCYEQTASILVLAESILEAAGNLPGGIANVLENTQLSHHVLAETRALPPEVDVGGDSDIDESSM
jgi:hypothetical protein